MASGDHRVACLQALENLDLAREPDADLGLQPLRDLLAVGTIDHLEYQLPTALGHQRFFGHHHGAFAHAEDHPGPGEHAGLEQGAAVVHRSTNTQRPAVRVDLRIKRVDAALEHLARQRVQRQLHRLPGAHACDVALGQRELHVQAGQVFDADEVGTVLHVVAHLHRADAQGAIERSQHAHACGLGLGQHHLRVGHLLAGQVLVNHALADEALRQQLAAPLQVGAGDAGLRLGLLQLGLLQGVVELHQHLAALDTVAIAKPQACDTAAGLGAQHHALAGLERTDCEHFIRQRHAFGARHLYRCGPAPAGSSARCTCWPTGPARPPCPGGRSTATGAGGPASGAARSLGRGVSTVLPPPGPTAGQGDTDHGNEGVGLVLQWCFPGTAENP